MKLLLLIFAVIALVSCSTLEPVDDTSDIKVCALNSKPIGSEQFHIVVCEGETYLRSESGALIKVRDVHMASVWGFMSGLFLCLVVLALTKG